MQSYTIANIGVTLYPNDIVVLVDYPNTKWIFKYGWYQSGDDKSKGWYFSRIPDGLSKSIDDVNLSDIEVLTQHAETPRPPCPPGPTPPCPPIPGPTSIPFTKADKFNTDRAFITVDNLNVRDSLSTKHMPHGKLVRVNDVDGCVKYYSWDSIAGTWDDVNIEVSDAELDDKISNNSTVKAQGSQIQILTAQMIWKQLPSTSSELDD